MRIYKEESLINFEFWQGAKSTADRLSNDELLSIEDALDDIYPEGLTDVQLNDIFWFDLEFLLELIGLTEDEFLAREV